MANVLNTLLIVFYTKAVLPFCINRQKQICGNSLVVAQMASSLGVLKTRTGENFWEIHTKSICHP